MNEENGRISSDTELVIACARDGDRTIPYVVHGGTAGFLCFRKSDRSVLLVRQFRAVCGLNLWEIPSGMIESGEAPEETAARELLEEAGVVAFDAWPVGVFLSSVGLTSESFWLYWTDSFEHRDVGNGGEFQARWVPLDSALAFLAGDGTSAAIDAKTALGLSWLATNAP